MQILPKALERLTASEFNIKNVVNVFKTLELAMQDAGAAEIVLHYQSDEDVVSSEDLIPVVIFRLIRCSNEEVAPKSVEISR